MIYVHVTIDKQDEIGGEKADKQAVRCSVKPSSSKKYVVRYVSDIYDMEHKLRDPFTIINFNSCYLEYAMKTKRCPKFPGIQIMRNRMAKET